MYPKNKFFPLLFVFVLFFSACSESEVKTGYVDQNEALLETLRGCEGREHTYNRYTNILQEREQVKYFVPESIPMGLQCIPEEMREKIHMISTSDLSFEVGMAKSNLVTSWNAFNKLVFQIQISYFENGDTYDSNFKDFFTISATQYPEDPFLDEEIRKTYEEDLIKGGFEILTLVDDHPLYRANTQNLWPTMFDFYIYNQEEDKIDKKSTGAVEYYTWYNGIVYRIGYKMEIPTSDAEALVRNIILGSVS